MSQYFILEKKYTDFLPLDVIKVRLWIDNNNPDEDQVLEQMLGCAIDAAESFLRRCIVTQTIVYTTKASTNKTITLPVAFATKFLSCKQGDREIENPESLMNNYDLKENMLTQKEREKQSITEIRYEAGWNQHEVTPYAIKEGVLHHIYNMHYRQSPALIQNNDSIELYQPYRRLCL